jgi:hypothetical protein
MQHFFDTSFVTTSRLSALNMAVPFDTPAWRGVPAVLSEELKGIL